MFLSKTDFPVPEGPRMAVIRPLGTSNVMSSSTVCDPNDLVTPRNEMMGSPGAIHAWVSPCGSDAMKGEPAIVANLAPRASRRAVRAANGSGAAEQVREGRSQRMDHAAEGEGRRRNRVDQATEGEGRRGRGRGRARRIW